MRFETPRTRTARHEAGHYYAAVVLGTWPRSRLENAVIRVCDEPTPEGYAGLVDYAPEKTRKEREPTGDLLGLPTELRRHVPAALRLYGIEALAGVCAEFADATFWSNEMAASWSVDRSQLEEIAQTMESPVPPFWPQLWRTMRLVDAGWGEILAVSAVLAERGQLRGAEALAIIRDAPRCTNPHRVLPDSVGREERQVDPVSHAGVDLRGGSPSAPLLLAPASAAGPSTPAAERVRGARATESPAGGS